MAGVILAVTLVARLLMSDDRTHRAPGELEAGPEARA